MISNVAGSKKFKWKVPRNLFQKDLDHFNTTVLKILDNESPIKGKNVRANEAPFMNSTIKKTIMKRSRLRNKFLKSHAYENNLNYKRQRNFCLTLLRNEKRIFFSILARKKFLTVKRFGRLWSHLFRINALILKT